MTSYPLLSKTTSSKCACFAEFRNRCDPPPLFATFFLRPGTFISESKPAKHASGGFQERPNSPFQPLFLGAVFEARWPYWRVHEPTRQTPEAQQGSRGAIFWFQWDVKKVTFSVWQRERKSHFVWLFSELGAHIGGSMNPNGTR